jgi:hypothetical protein
MAKSHYLGDGKLGEAIHIAQGSVADTSHINKFGYNSSVGASYETITDLGTNNLPSAAGVVSVVSASGSDDEGSTGAEKVEIQGLDGNYDMLTEEVTMNGTSAVTTTGTFLRVFRMRATQAGSGGVNAGNITASIGGSDVARISAGEGQTLMAVYTVPRGKKAYLIKFQGSLSKNQEANFQLRVKLNGGAWNVKGLWGIFSESVNYDYPIPLEFSEETDIQVRGKAGATSEMGAIFDLILVDV